MTIEIIRGWALVLRTCGTALQKVEAGDVISREQRDALLMIGRMSSQAADEIDNLIAVNTVEETRLA